MKKTFIFGKKWKKHLATAITAGLLAGVYAPSAFAFDSVITAGEVEEQLTVIDRITGKEIHVCRYYETIFCNNCSSRYDGEKIKKYMEDNPRIEH